MFFPFHARTVLSVVLAAVLLAPAAAADHVVDNASLAPDAISPNTDGVQDFTVIDYTVVASSADVQVLLAPVGGGPAQTLQGFTRQSAGPHSLVYDGLSAVDGSYEVWITGVGTQGEGTEIDTLFLEIDRVPPSFDSWDLSIPSTPVIRNGVTVTLQACVDGADSVYVDLSALDSEFDPAQISESFVPPNCRRFTYTVSLLNTIADRDSLPALVTAWDRAGNSSGGSLPLCLSNSPPTVVSASLLTSSQFLQNGDLIRAEIVFSAPGAITAGANFSNLDSGFNPNNVVSIPRGGLTFEIQYPINNFNTKPDQDYALHLFGTDEGCGVATDSSLVITLDNAGVNSSLIENVFVTPTAFAPGGSGITQVEFHFTVDVDSLTVSISTDALLQNPSALENIPIQTAKPLPRGAYTVIWDGSGGPSRPPERLIEQELQILFRATSIAVGERERNITIPLSVDHTPPQLLDFPTPGSLEFNNGQITVIPLTWDDDGYTINPDFSSIDSNFNPADPIVITPEGGGDYTISYEVSSSNAFPDSVGVPVFVSATDIAGNVSGTLSIVRGCVNNLPPALLSSGLTGNLGPFKGGDRITLETVWSTEPHQSPPIVTADFSAVDDRFDPVSRRATVVDLDDGLFEISYTISQANGIEEGTQLPILVTASDDSTMGCGSTTMVAARVDLDTLPGLQPTLTTPNPVVVTSVATVSGTAVEAIQVQIETPESVVDTFDVDLLDSSFSGQVSLEPGENVFFARSIDTAGNLSMASEQIQIFSAQSTVVSAPPRFGPGDEFFVALLQPADEVTVRIFNLAGVELQRIDAGAGDIYQIAWDGRDHTGNLATSGPCLAVFDVRDSNNGVRERVRKAFVFTRRGSQ